MDISQAETMVKGLMRTHGLTDQGWRFVWDRAIKRFGQCDYSRKTISISRALTEINPENEVRDTALHEIAHALAGHKAGHGIEWRRTARAIGCNASRTHRAAIPELRWSLVCQTPGCDTAIPRARRTATRKACARCCNRHAGGRFDARFLLVWRDNQAFANVR